MSGGKLAFHPEAITEAQAAVAWYRERSEAASVAFVLDLDDPIRRVFDGPELWPRATAGTRRCLLRRFPFALIYEIEADEIVVIAVAHARRRPGYWRRRPS